MGVLHDLVLIFYDIPQNAPVVPVGTAGNRGGVQKFVSSEDDDNSILMGVGRRRMRKTRLDDLGSVLRLVRSADDQTKPVNTCDEMSTKKQMGAQD